MCNEKLFVFAFGKTEIDCGIEKKREKKKIF